MSVTPKRVEDASRILRGIFLVAAQAAANSSVVRRLAAVEKEASSRAQEQVTSAAAKLSPGFPPSNVNRASSPTSASLPSAVVTESAVYANTLERENDKLASSISHAFSDKVNEATSVSPDVMLSSSSVSLSQSYRIENEPAPFPVANTGSELPADSSTSIVSTSSEIEIPISGNSHVLQAAGNSHDSALNIAAPALHQHAVQDSSQSSAQQIITAGQTSQSPQALQNASQSPQAHRSASQSPQVHQSITAGQASQSPQAHQNASQSPQAYQNASQSPQTHQSITAGQASQSLPGPDAAPATKTTSFTATPPTPPKRLREATVPSTSFGRALGFAGLGANLLYGTVRDSVGRYLRPQQQEEDKNGYSAFLSDKNAEILANALCRMRGAALKLGQMLSIQDENLMPPQWHAALERVRAGADVMPRKQLEGVMKGELGPGWHTLMRDFDFTPSAAASIGQVHRAVLHDGREVAMKVQYPGVARSISSDVDNLMRLMRVANIFPPGLYVEAAARVAKEELALECDYQRELEGQRRFRQLISSDPFCAQHFNVPEVFPELSTSAILTTEWVQGVHIDKCIAYPQETRDAIGTRLLSLTLKELFDWRFMQTDPNWGNFLYDQQQDKLHLIDFGAARDFPKHFVDDYLRMVMACADRDREQVVARSQKLGFLTGDESSVMLDAHTQAGFLVGAPFATQGMYNFAEHSKMTREVTEMGKVMLQHRLTPPPQESYSLHRKLSGAFLSCIKLKATVPCRTLLLDTYNNHDFDTE